MTNSEIVAAERDLLWSLLQRIAKTMHLIDRPSAGALASGYVAMLSLDPADYRKLKELQDMMALTEAGLRAMPTPTKANP